MQTITEEEARIRAEYEQTRAALEYVPAVMSRQGIEVPAALAPKGARLAIDALRSRFGGLDELIEATRDVAEAQAALKLLGERVSDEAERDLTERRSEALKRYGAAQKKIREQYQWIDPTALMEVIAGLAATAAQ